VAGVALAAIGLAGARVDARIDAGARVDAGSGAGTGEQQRNEAEGEEAQSGRTLVRGSPALSERRASQLATLPRVMSDKAAFLTRWTTSYARLIVNNPGRVLAVLLGLAVVSGYLTSKLTIESDQLALISQDLPEVKAVKRVIDMVGGAGYLMLAIRGNDADTLKKVSDELNARLLADKQPDGTPYIRFITYKVPVDFIQENMVLFIKTEDLVEGKKRINAYVKDQLRRNNPFFIEIKKTEPVKLDLKDLIDKYAAVGKKSIRDEYYISDDRLMVLMLIKPMWNSTELAKTVDLIDHATGGVKRGGADKGMIGETIEAARRMVGRPSPVEEAKPAQGLMGEVAAKTGVTLIEDYEKTGDKNTVYYGWTGSYKTGVDDSYAIQDSLGAVGLVAFLLILLITIAFFRKLAPTVIVVSGMVLGTLFTMGFAKVTLGQLNMVTSIIGAILAGFGIDYGIHFIYRTRIELGAGKRYDQAITDALINAGRPAFVAAIVTGGSFMVLLISQFRGFSQFGFLAAFGTLIIGLTLFSWTPAILALVGNWKAEWVPMLIGVMKPPANVNARGEIRIPNPKLVLGIACTIVAGVCAFAIPWTGEPLPKDHEPTMFERLKSGISFNYNTRALVPEDMASIKLQDEINQRFRISSDPIAITTSTLEESKKVWDELTLHPEKYPSVDQVVSVYSFVPPPEIAAANAKVLEEWQEELKDIDVESLPPEMQDKATLFKRILAKRPYGVNEVPEVYAANFRHLPTTKPENRGFMTFIYPGVDLWDGKKMLQFADEMRVIKTADGAEYHSAGLAILYATLARIVLFDGKMTVFLATLWILLMHYLDFRSVKLAAASVIPLGVGLWMMLGLMSITLHTLNFMNLVILPILLGFGVSHGLYLLHRFLEGTSPIVALRSVGAAVASSTLTAIAGFASLFFAQHNGLKSIGYVACLGLSTTLVISFTVLAAVLQLIHDKREPHLLGEQPAPPPLGQGDSSAAK
jgi:predicted RND superfamily exporter protein